MQRHITLVPTQRLKIEIGREVLLIFGIGVVQFVARRRDVW